MKINFSEIAAPLQWMLDHRFDISRLDGMTDIPPDAEAQFKHMLIMGTDAAEGAEAGSPAADDPYTLTFVTSDGSNLYLMSVAVDEMPEDFTIIVGSPETFLGRMFHAQGDCAVTLVPELHHVKFEGAAGAIELKYIFPAAFRENIPEDHETHYLALALASNMNTNFTRAIPSHIGCLRHLGDGIDFVRHADAGSTDDVTVRPITTGQLYLSSTGFTPSGTNVSFAAWVHPPKAIIGGVQVYSIEL